MLARKTLIAGAAALALSAGSALAQPQQQEGLVNVTVTDVELLKNVGINVPADVTVANVQVQVPIGIAAQVCGVDANVIAEQRDAAVTDCAVTQEQSNQAFNNLLKRNQTQIEQQLGG